MYCPPQELYIKGNELGDEGVKTVCEALQGHKGGCARAGPAGPAVRPACFVGGSFCCVQDSRISQACTHPRQAINSPNYSLHHCPPPPGPLPAPAELKAVDFGNNSMGKEGAEALAGLLRGSKAITDVNINMNDVGDDGAFLVGRAGGFADDFVPGQ